MAGKRITTSLPRLQDGSSASAISPSGTSYDPWFVAVADGEFVTSGYHLGRRRDWADPGRREIVWLDVQEFEDGWFYGVYRCGTTKPEDLAEWDISLRVRGIRSMPDEMMELEAISLH